MSELCEYSIPLIPSPLSEAGHFFQDSENLQNPNLKSRDPFFNKCLISFVEKQTSNVYHHGYAIA